MIDLTSFVPRLDQATRPFRYRTLPRVMLAVLLASRTDINRTVTTRLSRT